MDIRKIRKLIELMEETDISEIEIKEGEESLKLSRHQTASMESTLGHRSSPQPFIHHTTAVPQPSIAAEEKNALAPPVASGYKIRSPMVGTMYTSPSPESPPFVTVGQRVKAGDVLCIIEAMKMFNEIEADRSGRIVDVLVTNGEPIEYDQPLFILEE